MKIAVLGTGMVGEAIGSKLVSLGHQVMMGSRATGNEKALTWTKTVGSHSSQGSFTDAAKFGEMVFNCTKGEHAIEALKLAGDINLKGKIVVDISNPLDFSKGMPPTLSVCNDNSLAEEIQKAFPESHVVKTLNTLTATIMVNPGLVNGGNHHIFLSGNDGPSKAKVKEILQSFGWGKDNIIDLGNISTARGTEQLLALWVRLMGVFNSPMFQFQIVK
jgi:8-hydroxy-5-deazaflavin:NADPH oxidoreductase